MAPHTRSTFAAAAEPDATLNPAASDAGPSTAAAVDTGPSTAAVATNMVTLTQTQYDAMQAQIAAA